MFVCASMCACIIYAYACVRVCKCVYGWLTVSVHYINDVQISYLANQSTLFTTLIIVFN